VNNPFKEQSKEIVAKHAKAVEDYKPGSKANPTYGTAEHIKQADLKEKGERTNFPLEKPELPESKSNNLPASQGGSPFNIGQAAAQRDKSNAEFLLRRPAATPGKGSGVIPQLLRGVNNPGNNIMLTNAGGNTTTKIKPKKKIQKPVTSNNTNNTNNKISTSSNVVKSSGPQDSYKSSVTSTEFFGKDYSGGLKNSSSSTPKFESSVSNARSADYDIIRAKGRGRRSKLKTRLDKREARTANRVDNSLDRIESRQQRSGMKYEKGIQKQLGSQDNFDKGRESVSSKKTNANPPQQTQQSQEKSLDTQKKTKQPGTVGSTLGVSTKSSKIQVEKPSSNLPKNPGTTSGSISPGPSLNVSKSDSVSSNLKSSIKKVPKKSIKLNTSKQTSQTIDDSKIKKSAKRAKGSGIISAPIIKGLTGFEGLKTKPGSSSGMTRGKKRNTSIKRNDLSKGPRA
jgi:hypothetical protein